MFSIDFPPIPANANLLNVNSNEARENKRKPFCAKRWTSLEHKKFLLALVLFNAGK
jgi:hypothetical protein